MTPEEKARQQIDRMLVAAGWMVQDLRDLDLSEGPGVAVREFPLQSGEADYLLLKRAFAGKLVRQDPNDEPAKKLLERIHYERARVGARHSSRLLA